MLLALKMEESHESKNMVASKSWQMQGNGFSPRASRKESRKEWSPADTLILAQ